MLTAVHTLSTIFPPSSAAIFENRDRGIAIVMSGLPMLFIRYDTIEEINVDSKAEYTA